MKWLILLMSLAFGQQKITDSNFYGVIYKGMHLVRFTAEWSKDSKENFYQGKFIVEGDSAHMGTQMMILPAKNVSETVRKLRLRNFPSIALFVNGDKIDTWKGDMDGIIEVKPGDIKEAIEDAIGGDVF